MRCVWLGSLVVVVVVVGTHSLGERFGIRENDDPYDILEALGAQ